MVRTAGAERVPCRSLLQFLHGGWPVCLLVATVSCVKTAEPFEMPFGADSLYTKEYEYILDGYTYWHWQMRLGRWQIRLRENGTAVTTICCSSSNTLLTKWQKAFWHTINGGYRTHHMKTTRRHSESAYIRQVNFLQLLCMVGEGDGAPLKLNLYLKPFSK